MFDLSHLRFKKDTNKRPILKYDRSRSKKGRGCVFTF